MVKAKKKAAKQKVAKKKFPPKKKAKARKKYSSAEYARRKGYVQFVGQAPQDLYRRFKSMCAERGVTISSQLVRVIEGEVKRFETKKKRLKTS